MLRATGLGLLGCVFVIGAGCCAPSSPPPRAVVVPPPPTPILAPASFGQPQPAQVYVPGAFGPPTSGVPAPPPGAQFGAPMQQPPAYGPPLQQRPTTTNAPPPLKLPPPPNTDPQWKPGDNSEPPRIDSNRDTPPRINLYAPEPVDKDASKDRPSAEPPPLDKKQPGEEPPLKKPSVQGNIPPIKQFDVAKANVYSGLRPPLDGLDWLQANGVKIVVNVRLPNQDDSADRTQVEKRNMQYVAFEVSPQTLTKDKAAEFVKLIRDGAKQSIFVYDQDGALAGAMWYLHMRLGEILDDDAAQLRARPLGFDPDRPGQHRDMGVAVQKLLSELK